MTIIILENRNFEMKWIFFPRRFLSEDNILTYSGLLVVTCSYFPF